MAKTRLQSVSRLRGSAVPFIAGFAGVMVGVTGSLLMALPLMRSAITSAANQAAQRTVTVAPASTLLPDSCGQGAVSAGGQTLGASTGQQPATAAVSGQNTSSMPVARPPLVVKHTFVTELTGGVLAHTTASISKTGPSSKNDITAVAVSKTNIVNDNDIVSVDTSHQTAVSGAGSVSGNTSGGSASSGGAMNANSMLTILKLDN